MHKHTVYTSIESPTRRRNRRALMAFLAIAIGVSGWVALIAVDADASTSAASSYAIPRCVEDEVISRRGRCITRDDHTTRYRVVSEAGWGYWYDTRYPTVHRQSALVPMCHRWQMLTRAGGCVAAWRGDFRGGYWYAR